MVEVGAYWVGSQEDGLRRQSRVGIKTPEGRRERSSHGRRVGGLRQELVECSCFQAVEAEFSGSGRCWVGGGCLTSQFGRDQDLGEEKKGRELRLRYKTKGYSTRKNIYGKLVYKE